MNNLTNPPPPGTYLSRKPTKQELDKGRVCTNCRYIGASKEFGDDPYQLWTAFKISSMLLLGVYLGLINEYLGICYFLLVPVILYILKSDKFEDCPNCGVKKAVKIKSKKGKEILSQPRIG